MTFDQFCRLHAMADPKSDGWKLDLYDRNAITAALLVMPNPRLIDALKAVLMFHSGEPWTSERSREWNTLTRGANATTKGLCDFIRLCLKRQEIIENLVKTYDYVPEAVRQADAMVGDAHEGTHGR